MKPTYTETSQDVFKTTRKIITTYTVQISSYSQYILLKKCSLGCTFVILMIYLYQSSAC